jgi:D-alanyl-D-alanine carboxypeptidase/D-alanyl-D-alanine-endopeptidase (penicillin-binding protein 4)
MKRTAWICALLLTALTACGPSRQLHRQIDQAETEFQDHIGFTLYDPDRKRTLYDHQGDRYFIPASNTKLFTLYASLRLLGDSIPALRYVQQGDSLIFWGTGDPSFLYDDVVPSSRTLNFLARFDTLYFSPVNFDSEHFGPGWAWGDYRYAYQVERTPFPIYGNRFHMRRSGTRFVPSPRIFATSVEQATQPRAGDALIRDIDSNGLRYVPGTKDSSFHWEIPFHYSDDFLARLLSDTLKKNVRVAHVSMPADAGTFYSVPADSLYKVMMQESDNFIAEQLLLACAAKVSDTLRTDIAIREVKKRFLSDLPDAPVWVDGSGLSRMNLFTPRSIVALWDKTSQLVPRERLFSMLAVGGVSGTIRNNYKADRPYVFGKTGSLRNNHMLSGFLVTRSGRTLLFSWMNNNFTVSSGTIRSRMEEILTFIYERY